MSVEIRPLVADEMGELLRVARYSYADASPDDVPVPLLPEWTSCALVDGRLATTFGVFPFRVRLNGRSVAMGGVTMVSTLPEFRRRGLMRQVMTQALAEQREQGV